MGTREPMRQNIEGICGMAREVTKAIKREIDTNPFSYLLACYTGLAIFMLSIYKLANQ